LHAAQSGRLCVDSRGSARQRLGWLVGGGVECLGVAVECTLLQSRYPTHPKTHSPSPQPAQRHVQKLTQRVWRQA